MSDSASLPGDLDNLGPVRGDRIALLGAIRGDLSWAIGRCGQLRDRGITTMIQLGDFGASADTAALDRFGEVLAGLEQTFLFVDGNGNDFHALHQYPIDEDGVRWLRPRIGHLQRGFRTMFPSGKTLAAFGGAGSLDRTRKRRDGDWSPEEMITDENLGMLGVEHVDILVAHNAPSQVPALNQRIETVLNNWTDSDIRYANMQRDIFTLGFLNVSPTLHLSGGYPFHVDQTLGYWNHDRRNAFACRVVLLDHATGDEATTAILDTESLNLEFFDAGGAPLPPLQTQVTDLTTQTSGRWAVHTVSSVQIFDLDGERMTWTRLPGPDATFGWYAPEARVVDKLVQCRVGGGGFWLLPDRGDRITSHRSSVIHHIERLPDKENDNAGR